VKNYFQCCHDCKDCPFAIVDGIVKKLKTTRSAFVQKALKEAIRQVNINQLEKKHKKGYERYPVGKTEFSVWEPEQEHLYVLINN